MTEQTAAINSLISSPLLLGGSLLLMGVVPFALLAVTSFLKLNIVFTLLKNALGAGQVPGTAITSLLSLTLTMFIMAPVARSCLEAFDSPAAQVLPASKLQKTSNSTSDLKNIFARLPQASAPLLAFLAKHSNPRERLFFLNIHQQSDTGPEKNHQSEIQCLTNSDNPGSPCIFQGEGFFSLVPAFVLSELREAFALGFLLFLPFLVVDLVVANLLVGVGMSMVTPATVSLPLKIILFVTCDGWFLLCRSLVLGYQ